MMAIFLETARLTLRRFTAADVADLCALDADPAVTRFLTGGVPTPCDVIRREILPRFLRSYAAGAGYGYWAAIVRATGEFAGWFNLRPVGAPASGEAELAHCGVDPPVVSWLKNLPQYRKNYRTTSVSLY